ncbi:MAG: hypothetical protein IK086_06460 [Clostridia bacterium]|nr:hypothetical protein [Clostridia bacterium]
MLKKLLISGGIVISLIIIASVVLGFYITRPISVYSKTVKANATEIDLSGENISSVDELLSALTPFKRLKKLNINSFYVPAEEEDKLLAGLPGVKLDYKLCVTLYGVFVNSDEATVDLSDKGITDLGELSAALKKLPLASEVNLRGNPIENEPMLKLIKEYPDVFFDFDVNLLGKIYDSGITELDLSGNKAATPELLREYAPFFAKLKRLNMSDCGATDEEMAALREDLPGVKVVWRIHMGKWSLKTDAVAFSVLIYDYNYTRLKNEDIEVLKYCTDLQALDLGHQAITDISVLGDYLPQLRILILADNQVSDLTPVAKMKHLHYIELFVNSHKLCDLSPLGSCKELVDANVSYLYNVKDISPLYELPMLERIWFEHTPISADQIKTLQEKHPDAKIISVGTGSIDQGWRTHERYFEMIKMFLAGDNCKELSESFSKYDG